MRLDEETRCHHLIASWVPAPVKEEMSSMPPRCDAATLTVTRTASLQKGLNLHLTKAPELPVTAARGTLETIKGHLGDRRHIQNSRYSKEQLTQLLQQSDLIKRGRGSSAKEGPRGEAKGRAWGTISGFLCCCFGPALKERNLRRKMFSI